MTLQDRIISLSAYSLSFETYDGNFVVAIAYKPNWKVREPENKKIKFYADPDNRGVCYYEMPVGGDIEEIFKCIDEVISHNKEIEKKIELFKVYVETLKNMFKNETLSTLEGLEFKLKKKKEKNKIKDTDNNTTIVEKPSKTPKKTPSKPIVEPKEEVVEEPKKTVDIDINIENKISQAIDKKTNKNG